MKKTLSTSFHQFFHSEKTSGILLIACTLISLLLANSYAGADYLRFWHHEMAGMSLAHWINDGLMAIFFLMIGLELERELYSGELADFKKALLPIFAAVGGMLVPALIHLSLNAGTATQPGVGIPMATDIAFAIGILALLGKRIPASLKVFVVAFAVIDDLGAALLIALFYTAQLNLGYLLAAVAVWLVLVGCNRMRIMSLLPYLIGGAVLWLLMLKSGVHATIAGIALAFAIPFSAKRDDAKSPSHRLEQALHTPVAFIILPIFALANTGVLIDTDLLNSLISNLNAIGIMAGLVLGKPLGVVCLCYIAVRSGLCKLPPDLNWRHIMGAGLLGGIGFTMSIFITNLAFVEQAAVINASKLAILMGSLLAGILGYAWLKWFTLKGLHTKGH